MLGHIITIVCISIFAICMLLPLVHFLLDQTKGHRLDLDTLEDQTVILVEFAQHANNLVQDQIHPEIKTGIDVHDHTVQESLVKSYKKLQEWFRDSPSISSLSDVKKAVFANKDTKLAEHAYSTLRTMEKYNGYVSSLAVKELNILDIVWARINDPVNTEVKDELIESLTNQLADASMNLDLSRCLTGRVSRIIQSLEALDKENIVHISSTEDIRRELSDKVPALISRYSKETDETGEVKMFVDAELRKDYVDTHLLTESEYIKISQDYLDAIEI